MAPKGKPGKVADSFINGWIKYLVGGFPDKKGVVAYPAPDPRVADWPLADPFWPAVISVIYIAIVIIGIARDKAARKSGSEPKPPPAFVKPMAAVHNTILFLLSCWMAYETFTQAAINFGWFDGKASPTQYWMCNTVEPPALVKGKPTKEFRTESGYRLARVMWVHYLSKIYEMVDTVIMLLKGNMRQVSFLHVYHHATTFYPFWWAVFRYGPGGDPWLPCAFNSLVHVFMYGYYFEAAIKFPVFFTHFKKYLTQFQMFQFCTYIYHAATIIYADCYRPRISFWIQLGHSALLLAMFAIFYVQSYNKKAKEKAK